MKIIKFLLILILSLYFNNSYAFVFDENISKKYSDIFSRNVLEND